LLQADGFRRARSVSGPCRNRTFVCLGVSGLLDRHRHPSHLSASAVGFSRWPAGPRSLRLDETATVDGTVERSEIGANCVVETGAVVRNSVLLAGAHAAAGAVIEGSIVGWGATVGAGATVRNLSVIGHGAKVPAGEALDGVTFPK